MKADIHPDYQTVVWKAAHHGQRRTCGEIQRALQKLQLRFSFFRASLELI
jgi:hypothetical protein